MRSSAGQHWLALDHVRAFAALLVFTFHFMHTSNGAPVALAGAPRIFPLALFDEGHTGVALFMTLSGYLFAKLLDGRQINLPLFLIARALRLAPLFAVVVIMVWFIRLGHGEGSWRYALSIPAGLILPVWPNGGWSLTVEWHFYLLLPLLLWLIRRWPLAPLLILAGAFGLRSAIVAAGVSAQDVAYWTIFGRIDQFVLGILAFRCRDLVRGQHGLAAIVAIAFAGFYWWFDRLGGFVAAPDRLWLVMPAIEGAAYALLIAWYDSSFQPRDAGWSRLIGRYGTYSYSIYLLHFFVVFRAARFVDAHIMGLSNIYLAFAWSLACFAAMLPIGWLSYQLIERPFLKLRRPYLRRSQGDLPLRAIEPEIAEQQRVSA